MNPPPDLATIDGWWRAGLAPEPQLSVSAWADRHRHLSKLSAEPGPWRTDRTPYLRAIMDALAVTSPFERVVLMKGAQIGATEAGLNFLGYAMHHAGGVILLVMPSLSDVKRNTRVRIDPMIDASPALRDIVSSPRSRSGANTMFEKQFVGGLLTMTGANSASALASTPVRFLMLDEVDRFPSDVDGEGDPVALAIQRTATFRGRRKVYMVSTPTVAGVSRIERAYDEGDRRKFFVRCIHCGDAAPITWARIRWPEDKPSEAALACDSCGALMDERNKPTLLANGEWRATAAGDGRTASFHISALYSPFETWGEIAVEFLAAKRDPATLQTFVNLKLGEPFEDRETAPLAADVLAARAEDADPSWAELLPDGVALITAGVDVQNDRLECEIVGWGRGEESWSLAYDIIAGDTSGEDVWNALDRLLARRFRHPRAVPDLPVAAVAIDSGGHRTDIVMQYAAARQGRRVWAIKGRGGPGVPPWPKRPPKAKRGGVAPVFIVGVDSLKSTLYARLRHAETQGPGVVHLPVDRDGLWFSGLVAERPVRKWNKGVARIEWLVDKGVRNEPLDCRVYATAALHGLRAAGISVDDRAGQIADAPQRGAASDDRPGSKPNIVRSRFLER